MPSPISSKPLARIPLRVFLITPFIIQILLTSGLVGYFSFRNGQQAVNDLADQLRSEINAHVEAEMLDFFATPTQINQLNADAIRQGWLDPGDQAMLQQHFLQQVQVFDSVSSIYFGNPQGGLANAGREGPGGALYVIETENFVRGTFHKYAVDWRGERLGLVASIPNFDASARLWYKGAVGQGATNWSEIYILFTGQDMAIAVSQPAFDPRGRLLGVVSVDLFLAQLSDFLKTLEIGKTGQSFIIERSGLLVASSANVKLFIPVAGEAPARRLDARESASLLISGAAQALRAQPGGLAAVTSSRRFEFAVDGAAQFAEATPIADGFGLDWLIVTVVPEEDFMAQIHANNRYTIALMILAALMALLLDISIARWISRPILRLNEAAQSLARGDWAQAAVQPSRIHEVSQLSLSFTRMAAQLKQTMDSLTAEIAERKESEKLLQIQHDLALNLVTAHRLRSALKMILDAALSVSRIDCGGIYLVNPENGDVDIAVHRGLSEAFVLNKSHYRADSPNAQRIAAGKPLYVYYPEAASNKSQWSMDEGLRLLAVIPVLHDGKAVASINLASRSAADIPERSRQALEAIAAQIGPVLEHMRATEALESSQQSLQGLFDALHDFIFILDTQGRILATNPVVTGRLGFDPSELIGAPVLKVHPAARREEAAAIIAEMIAGRRDTCDIPLVCKDGAEIPVETRISRARWYGQEALIGVCRDMSDRFQAERLQNALYQISEAASEAVELDDLYRQVHEIIQGLMHAENYYIAIYDSNEEVFRFPYHVDQFDENPGEMPRGRTLTDYVMRTGQPLLADPETFARLEAQGEVETVGAPSVDWLGAPLKSADGTAWGVMVVQSYTEGIRYNDQDRFILTYVSTQVALVIQRKQIEAAEKKQRTLAEALLDTATALNSTLDIEALYDIILVNLSKFVAYDSADIMMLDGEDIRLAHRRGRAISADWRELRFSAAEYPGMHAHLHSLKPAIIPDTLADAGWVFAPGAEWMRTFAGVPLRVQQKIIGRLGLDSASLHAFSAEDIAKVQAFADQAALAIENARLYAEVQFLAVVDELTGVYNRRGLFTLGQRDMDRAERFSRPLAALFIDLDHFKEFNDQHSYQTGDMVLRHTAERLRSHLREVDLVGRYGGEEFVVLLPETDQPAAEEVAERLRSAVENARYPVAGGKLSVNISVGGCLNHPGEDTLESLIARASQALQRAKKAGRNCVYFYNDQP
ncbi:MAG: diguanylate cyclase [Chloroflexi bacterium]|nr:diguanylate cyclase [Chloroflexota bacterium]